jgi:hypothetical protein
MTPSEAAAALFKTMPTPLSVPQLEEYGIEVPESSAKQIAREILSLNLYWVLAAVDAHIPTKYRIVLKKELIESIQTKWWSTGQLGTGTWEEYQVDLSERREHYARLVDQEGINPMGICAEAAALIEDQDIISSVNREKLMVLLLDYAPAAEYGRLLDNVG